MRWIIFIAIYAAFGLAFGVVLYQPIHSVASGYFWAWTLGWPAIIAAWALKWIMIVVIVFFIIIVAFVCVVSYYAPSDHRPRR